MTETRAQRRLLQGERTRRILIWVAGILVAVTTVGAIAVFSGAISTAQQAPAPATAQAPAPATVSQAATPASPTAPAATAPQPQVTKQENYEDWLYTCVQAAGAQTERCSITQRLSDQASNATIFLWRIIQDGKGGLVGLWQTPPQVLLSRGIAIDAGTPKPITIPYEQCGDKACQAVATLAPDFLETLAKSQKITVTFVFRDGRAVPLPISAKGLAAGIAALKP